MLAQDAAHEARPEISVYWVPGCSSCIKAKEFVSGLGERFESLNVLDHPDALAELERAGIRGAPAVRKGGQFVYAQSLDDLAAFFGRTREDKRLARDVLVARWDKVQDEAREVIAGLSDEVLDGHRLQGPHANARELAEHAFQVVESFLRLVEDDSIDARAIYLTPDPSIRDRSGVLAYADRIRADYDRWRDEGGPAALPARLRTHYGIQPADVVLERYVWHMAQHARQLDHVAEPHAGGLRIPAALYEGLPMPKALWT